MVIADFRAAFPEFSDTTVYPDAQVTFWSTLAEAQLNKCSWATVWTQAVMLYTAHEIVIAAQNVKSSSIGGSPGQAGGIANSKAVGGVNVAFDATTQTEKDAGWFNRTTYGQQLYALIRIYGAGCIQL